MVKIKRCSLCRRPSQGPVATAYWRWFPNETDSVGYRIYYCNDCWKSLASAVNLQLATSLDSVGDVPCTICGTTPGVDAELVYIYLYPPKQENVDLIVPSCGACLNKIVEDVRQYGTRLEDRDQTTRAVVEASWGPMVPTG